MLHVIIPRTDYEIIEDSWDVVGLRGTGSKDVVVKDAFVPDYRVMDCDEVIDGTAVRKYGRTETLYLICRGPTCSRSASRRPRSASARGVLHHANEYQRERINPQGTAVKDDPYTMFAVGEATAKLRAARDSLLANVDRMWDLVDAGKTPTFEQRALGRETQSTPPGRPSRRSTRSTPAAAATHCAWTSRCSASGVTHTRVSPRDPRPRHRVPRGDAEQPRRGSAGSAAFHDLIRWITTTSNSQRRQP